MIAERSLTWVMVLLARRPVVMPTETDTTALQELELLHRRKCPSSCIGTCILGWSAGGGRVLGLADPRGDRQND